uniref:Uncharacterized protein n=1 Tax=Hippocampus comes TaxID=109280 RepID=A0A3Q2YP94_HIPCM
MYTASSLQSVLASHAIANQCKSKKPLSAAKACIPQILPSKFKPKLLPPGGDIQESSTRPVKQPKAHSCEDLYTSTCDRDRAGTEVREGCHYSDSCADGLREVSPAVRRSASEFSSMYKIMHHIQRPRSVGCSPQGSVRSLAYLFEGEKANGDEKSEADGGKITRDTVLSRVTEFEMYIQQSSLTPSRSSSLPTLNSNYIHSPERAASLYLPSAVSAESLLVVDNSQTDACSPVEAGGNDTEESFSPRNKTVDEAASPSKDGGQVRAESACSADPEVVQILKKSSTEQNHSAPSGTKTMKCKGPCPASYTRFTTILRHERQQATVQQEKPAPPEKKTMLPGNLLLMGPAPFRLRKSLHSQHPRRTLSATKVITGTQRPHSTSPELKPLIPQRLSSLEVLERLSNGEGDNCEQLSNGQGLDANGNLLQPLAANHRGGYLHSITTVILLPSSVLTHSAQLFTLSPVSTHRHPSLF